MQNPNLDRMWETFIRTSTIDVFSGKHLDIIRFKIYPMIQNLTREKVIDWYCFLIHRNPKDENDPNPYFHIRVSIAKNVDHQVFCKSLPNYCLFTQPIKREAVSTIRIGENVYFDTSLFKTKKIEDVWRIIGEQSEWLLKMLNAHKENADIPFEHIKAFYHYYFNMINLHCCCPNCKNVFRPDFYLIPWNAIRFP